MLVVLGRGGGMGEWVVVLGWVGEWWCVRRKIDAGGGGSWWWDGWVGGA